LISEVIEIEIGLVKA